MTSAQKSRPRGVETALRIWEKVEKGALISEQLRALADDVSAADRTLKDKETDEAFGALVAQLKEKLGAELR